ncbi:MAG: hypothetical protein EOP84_20740 [Verrucomicrobiaceae bacterium]|nr:MAG: hypothetical protein EOP84_20740 [Verrucomicrobiaceae bacterium]
MKNEMLFKNREEQPWWCVRPQLLITLAILTVICAGLWIDNPAKSWMVTQVVHAEMPEIRLFVGAR